MTKHHEKNQKRRQRKRATNIKLKAKIDTNYANLGTVECDGLGKVAALVNPVASETKQLLVPEKLDSPAELSLPKKASKKRKRKKNAIDQVVLESGPNANSIPIVDEKDSKREEGTLYLEDAMPFAYIEAKQNCCFVVLLGQYLCYKSEFRCKIKCFATLHRRAGVTSVLYSQLWRSQ